MEMNYCRRCGEALKEQESYVYRCANQHTIYATATPSTGVYIVDDKKNVTLSVRGIEPRKGMLDAFGGFLDGPETVEDGLKRELYEELGLNEDDYTEPVFLCSGTGNYPYEGEAKPIIGMYFYIQLHSGVILNPQDDVADVATFALADIPIDRLSDTDIAHSVQVLQKHLS